MGPGVTDPAPCGQGTWRVCADTGGTFTDAVGIDPSGRVCRAKVLSSGMVRGVVSRVDSLTRLVVDQRWGNERGVVGLGVRVAGREGSARVVGFGEQGVMELSSPITGVRVGDVVEVWAEEEAPTLAARLITGTPLGSSFPAMTLRVATTRGTNALLTRRVAPTALFVTRGLGDLLEIGTQDRPDLFALTVVKPAPLAAVSVEVPERVGADGSVIEALDVESVRARACELVESGVACAAIALMHSDRYPEHERKLAAFLRSIGFEHVTCSSEVAPFIKITPRAQTAVIDACLSPIIRSYLGRVKSSVSGSSVAALSSAGALVEASAFRAKDCLLSGPAGGVVGARRAARASGMSHAISFDMGGTSTDVARLDDDGAFVYEHQVGDAKLVSPAVGVETVAAGGGSICGFDGVRLFVGPQSAGASPGPACYGAGGPLTLTDVNLLLGRLDPTRMPIPIDRAKSEAALAEVRASMESATGSAPGPEALLAGFLRIAAERMGGAVKRVSARLGYDPRAYALVAFGGAGGQHACAVADHLGMRTVVIPRDAGLLSAVGLMSATVERFAEKQALRKLGEVEASGGLELMIGDAKREAHERAVEAARTLGIHAGNIAERVVIAARVVGQESTLELDVDDVSEVRRVFADRYASVYGHPPETGSRACGGGRDIEIVWVRALASIDAERVDLSSEGAGASALGATSMRAYFDGAWRDAAVVDRAGMRSGEMIDGPAFIREDHGATVVEPGWKARIDVAGAIVLERTGSAVSASIASGDEISLEIFTSRCESIAKEMGETLRRTAVSTNVKERLDFSCAILDAEGELIVNAPHVPVHLGSLGVCVRAAQKRVEMKPGDVVVTNHPAFGGSHLPDITVITPIFNGGGELVAYAASRAHHAEIGGVRPGSMAPGATKLVEEGVVIAPMKLVDGGTNCEGDVERVLRGAVYPTRNVSDNLADLRAAAAANQRGAVAIRELAASMGADGMAAGFERIKERGRRSLERALQRMSQGVREAEETLDDGTVIKARVDVGAGRIAVDFTGTSGEHPNNLNATEAIVRSAVIYTLRLLVDEPIPLNEGLMRAVELTLPPCFLSPVFVEDPARCPAVAAGNVETSQRVVDTLLKALGIAGCSQGTMNNVVFGTERGDVNYYETICGGCGATAEGPGASAVHSHMTNTRITDPEILETRYPVRLERFAVRRGSGGDGKLRGGDGVERVMRFLAPLSLSVLTQHRVAGPYGMDGGASGAAGEQRIVRADGRVQTMGSVFMGEVNTGDTLVMRTPGGGGYGAMTRS